MHPDMTGFLRLAHEMADRLIVRDLEIEIDFHTTFVSVCRHSIPGAAWLKLCHTHLKLACRDDLLYKHPVDDTVVALFESTEFQKRE